LPLHGLDINTLVRNKWGMKRILLTFSALLLANPLLAMQQPARIMSEPSDRIRNYIHNALEAFEIPKESVKIYGFTYSNVGSFEGALPAGITDSGTREIAMHENLSDSFTEYASFHEVAHMKDNASKKTRMHAALLTGAFGIPCLSLPFFLSKTETAKYAAYSFPIPFFLASLAYDCTITILLRQFYSNIAHPWAVEQCEYRADKMAIEKLIELSKNDPKKLCIIMEFISCKKTDKYEHKKQLGHPSSVKEYAAAKKVLEKNGFAVTETKEGLDLIVALDKDGLKTSLNLTNYFYYLANLKDGVTPSRSLLSHYSKI
jgi:hypothetical protein